MSGMWSMGLVVVAKQKKRLIKIPLTFESATPSLLPNAWTPWSRSENL